MSFLSPSEDQTLRKFYSQLLNNTKSKLSRNQTSVLLYFLKTREATRFSLLRKSSLSPPYIEVSAIPSLLELGYIQGMEELNTYTITAKGTWYIEKRDNKISEDDIINYIDTNFYTMTKKEKMNHTEKVILLSLLMTRSFSLDSCVDLNKEEYVKNEWLNVLKKSYDVINAYVKNDNRKVKKDNMFKPRANVHIVSYLFRHNNKMKQKTKDIYSYSGDQQYYLNVYSKDKINVENLGYLFYKVFEGNLNSEQVEKISSLCNKASEDHSIYLFDVANHEFAHPKYHIIIRDALIESISKKNFYDNL